ncbi:hypothetical protein [Curtobacterium oceanosedimentum]|uniref:hypothetical protein n=1 Tax=Curtobacterium oceanosedimentum TaxID=465820 RepID=UPI003394CC3B
MAFARDRSGVFVVECTERNVHRDLQDALDLLGWVHPAAAEWAADVTSLGAVLDARPSG